VKFKELQHIIDLVKTSNVLKRKETLSHSRLMYLLWEELR
jgi:hypothetical protein